MKARMISKQLRDAEGLANQMWQGMLEAVLDSEGVCLAAVKRYFGLGNKRMTEFLGCLKEVKDEFAQHGKDAVFDVMLKREFEEIGIDIRTHLIDNETLDHAIKRIEKQFEPEVTVKEAKIIQKDMISFRNVLR